MKFRKVAAAAMAALMLPGQALLAQTGGVVTSGVAEIARTGNVTDINQTTEKAAINWQTFGIRQNETVNFNQPGRSSVTLNRVVGNERSVIEGALNANGQVFLLNSNGVLATRTSSVNAGGFVASTLNITDEDFNAGRYIFKGNGRNGSVINQGTITAKDGGYVALLGGTASNQGVIVATKGTVVLASGDKVRLSFDNPNGGNLLGVAIDEGALNALVESRGAVIADGGRVYLTAKAAGELFEAQVNTSGIVRAQTVGDLKGRIELHAHGGTANVAGTLDASAPNGGDGGFVETSGDSVRIADYATVTTQSAKGANGEWLIDPDGFTVGATANDGDMSAATLNASLANGNVTIASTNGRGSDGNINVNGAVSWSRNTLTLEATNNVFINNIVMATGTAGLTANYGKGTNTDETPMGLYTAHGDTNSRIDFSGTGVLKLGGETYTVINTASQLNAARSNPAGRYALGSDITPTGTWTPLDNNAASGFTGKFNGLGHTVSNLKGAATSMFGAVGTGAALSNFRVTAAVTADSSSRKTSAGLVADVNRGTIVNVIIPTSTWEITDLSNRTTSIAAAGVLVGTNHGLIAQSRADSSFVYGVANTTGGLVGVNEATGRIVDSSAWGGMRNEYGATTGYVGGLVGMNGGTVKRSHATSTIALTTGDYRFRAGGFVGVNTGTGIISESFRPSSNLASAAPQFGGFAGENAGLIENAYTAMFDDIAASSWDAGFAYVNSGTIRNAYTLVHSSIGDSSRHGFAQTNTGKLENVYWAVTGGEGYSEPLFTPGATRLTDDQAKNLSSYGFANMADVWGVSKSGQPILRNIPVYVVSGNLNYYGDAISYTAAGLQGGDSLTVSGANPFTVVRQNAFVDAGVWNAGDILASASYANVRGNIKINPRPLTISGIVGNKTYDGTMAATLRSGVAQNGLVGLVGGQTLDIVYAAAAFQDKDAGYGKAVNLAYTASDGANGGRLSNYVLPLTTTATITPKPVSVVIVGNDKTYDGTTAATVGGLFSGVIAGDDLSLAYASAYFDNKNAGDRNVTATGLSLAGADRGNYTLSGQTSATATAKIASLPLQLFGFADEGGSTRVGAANLTATNVAEGDSVTLGGSVGINATAAGSQPITDFSALTVDNPNYTAVGSVGSIIVGNANLMLDRVAEGNATVTTSGKTTTVSQTTDKAVLDWMRLSLGKDETLVFDQPSANSIVLNRVVTGLRSVIEGAVRANGRVFILNAGGILFTADSSVNVGGLVASAFDLTNEDFLRNSYVFTVSRGNGSVIAEGDIVIADGGFVALAGKYDVKHTGKATGGDAALFASTDSLTLTLNNAALIDYAIGDLTGATMATGSVSIGTNAKGGRLLTAGDTVTANGLNLSTGTNGAWDWRQNGDITIGAGQFSGSFANDNLKSRSLSLASLQGDVTVNSVIDWSANTTLALDAAKDININKSIKATGANAGLAMDYGGDYHLTTPATFSGAELDASGKPVAKKIPAGTEFSSVTLSGVNAKLSMNGDAYTLIHSMEEFAALDDATGTATGYFALAGDLDAAAWSKANMGATSVVGEMSGTLAGLGHTVDNLTLNAPIASYLGLIHQMTTDAATEHVLRDIGVTNVDITGGDSIGALAGSAINTSISQSYSTGKIQALIGGNVGGLGGYGVSVINSSYSDVDIVAVGNNLGGLVGSASVDGITIVGSHATGSITGPRYALGYYVIRKTGEKLPAFDESGRRLEPPLEDYYTTPSSASDVGGLLGSAVWANIDMSYATGKVTSVNGGSIGGLVGTIRGDWESRPFHNAVTNSFATGNVVGGYSVGGLIGSIGDLLLSTSKSPVIVDNTYATGNVIATAGDNAGIFGSIGGLIGSSSRSEISNSYATGNVISISGDTTNSMGGLVGRQIDGSVSGSYATGTVVGNGGRNTGGLVGNQGGAINDSYYQDANVARAAENAPARAEMGGITESIQSRESDRARNKAKDESGDSASERHGTRIAIDQFIDYDDNSYSARIKAISVECNYENEDCER